MPITGTKVQPAAPATRLYSPLAHARSAARYLGLVLYLGSPPTSSGPLHTLDAPGTLIGRPPSNAGTVLANRLGDDDSPRGPSLFLAFGPLGGDTPQLDPLAHSILHG